MSIFLVVELAETKYNHTKTTSNHNMEYQLKLIMALAPDAKQGLSSLHKKRLGRRAGQELRWF